MKGDRRGFVLITVLWILIGIGVLAFTASYATRTATLSAQNRRALAEARWRAHGCIERARAAAHEAIAVVPSNQIVTVWDSLDRILIASPLLSATGCHVTARAGGVGLNINAATPEQLERWLTALKIAPTRVDSLVDALLDWRDSDTLPRLMGAENAWYITQHRTLPRNGAFRHVQELQLVRGFEQFGDTLNFVRITQERMPLSHTPLAVLAAFPGFSQEVLSHISDFRRRGEIIKELSMLGASASARDSLEPHSLELTKITSPVPESWILEAQSMTTGPKVESISKVRLVRAGARIAIIEKW